MIYPKFVKLNDCIGVPAPSAGAGAIERVNKINKAIEIFTRLGYKLKLSENIMINELGRSAKAEVRADEVNRMFEDDDINMLLCSAGGEFLVEILPYINFDTIKNNPKLIAGFSDPTGLLYPITTKLDIATIYGQNFNSFGMERLHKSQEDFLEIIKGNLLTQHSFDLFEDKRPEKITGLEFYNLTHKVEWKTFDNKPVNVRGRIIGGCFDIISHLAGTKYDGINEFNEKYKDDGIIWYFDHCELSKEDTIRTLWKMGELGYFKYTKCVIFGRFGLDISMFDYDAKTCLQDSVLGRLGIPIIYDADMSHRGPSINIINGSIANLQVADGKATINFELI